MSDDKPEVKPFADPPICNVVGSGSGATATATISNGGVITGITITTPNGNDYTECLLPGDETEAEQPAAPDESWRTRPPLL